MISAILVFVSAAVLLTALGLCLARLDALGDTPWHYWSTALVVVVTSTLGLSAALRAREMGNSAAALAELKVLSAAEVRRDLAQWQGAPVVLQDDTTCVEAKALPDGTAVLASRTRLKGEDEFEGEDSDYIKTVDYGVEQDVVRFRLGAEADAVQVDADGWQVWPSARAVDTARGTGEYSTVARRELQEFQSVSVIPCGARVAVSGLVRVEGNFVTLAPLAPRLNVVTDRPWPEVLTRTGRQAEQARVRAITWLVVNLGLAAVLGFLFASRRRAA
ncbi:MAG: hypothetical protein VKQ33_00770 [Candidatus Sericytochromatia bacterium]|nr:hypothetical protein [Candidatus Sericytochromatia bacterium]